MTGVAPRSWLISALGAALLVLGTLATPISVVSLLMIAVGADGSATVDPLGFLTVVVAPPAAAAAGLGLLWRQRWAAAIAALLLAAVMVSALWRLFEAPVPQHTIIGADGVPTTVLASQPPDALAMLLVVGVCAAALAALLWRRGEFAAPKRRADRDRGWRVGHRGRDMLYYEEWRDGAWRRLEISGELLTGPAHHAIYFDSPQRWQTYPEWARQRRDEIIGRITSELRPPDYEHGEPAAAVSLPPRPAPRPTASRQEAAALRVAVALLLVLSGGLLWMAGSSLVDGATVFPSTHGSHRRAVLFAQEPLTFAISVGLYGTAGLAALGLAAWLLRQGRNG